MKKENIKPTSKVPINKKFGPRRSKRIAKLRNNEQAATILKSSEQQPPQTTQTSITNNFWVVDLDQSKHPYGQCPIFLQRTHRKCYLASISKLSPQPLQNFSENLNFQYKPTIAKEEDKLVGGVPQQLQNFSTNFKFYYEPTIAKDEDTLVGGVVHSLDNTKSHLANLASAEPSTYIEGPRLYPKPEPTFHNPGSPLTPTRLMSKSHSPKVTQHVKEASIPPQTVNKLRDNASSSLSSLSVHPHDPAAPCQTNKDRNIVPVPVKKATTPIKKTIIKPARKRICSSSRYEDSTVFLMEKLPLLPLRRKGSNFLQRVLESAWRTSMIMIKALFDRSPQESIVEQSVTTWSSQNPYWP